MTCDRVVIIDRGHIIASDSEHGLAQKVLAQRCLMVDVARPDEACLGALQTVDGVQGVELEGGAYRLLVGDADPREEVARTVVDGGWGLLEQKLESASLEEIYLKLVGAGIGGPATAPGLGAPGEPAEPVEEVQP